ncbi:MAG: carbohydrate transporter rane protein 1, family [Nocardioides sp.]|nr:carbohydrate transporter rane protein 1, family [Nocardioides sp.]
MSSLVTKRSTPPSVTDASGTAEAAVDARSPKRGRRRHGRFDVLWFLGVPILLIVAVEIVPMLGVVWISLTDYNPLEPDSWLSFVGGENYSRMLGDDLFWQSLLNTSYFALLYLPIAIFGAMVAAILLNQQLRGRLVFRGIFFMPVVVSWVVGSTMIMWFLDPSSGLPSMISESLGFGRLPQLLQDESTAMPTVAFVAIWKYFGYNTVIYLAGLQAIDSALDEAAKVDGASALRRFWHITLPGLRPVTAVVVMLNMIQAMRIFDPMMIMTNGGPNNSTTSTVLYVYRMAWDNLQFGYGSAITAVLSVIIFAIAGLQFWFFNRRSVER